MSTYDAGLTFRLTRAARSHDTSERGNTGHARAGPVRRVRPGVIRLVDRGFLTDEAQDAGSDVRFTPGRRATPAAPASFASANTRAMVAPGGSVLGIARAELRACGVENTTGAPNGNQKPPPRFGTSPSQLVAREGPKSSSQHGPIKSEDELRAGRITIGLTCGALHQARRQVQPGVRQNAVPMFPVAPANFPFKPRELVPGLRDEPATTRVREAAD